MNVSAPAAVTPDMARGLRERLRRGGEPDRPLAALLADPGTVRAAAAAFDLADRPDVPWWPCAAAVGADAVSLRLAGLTVPEAEAPWRAGHDPRIWVADRDVLESGESLKPASDHRPLLIGRFDDMVVFVDTRRAPGPISVIGEPESVGGVRDLIDRQVPGRSPDAGAETDGGPGAGAHWPLDVEGDVIRFLGLAVATTLSESEARQAIQLVRRANAGDDPVDDAKPEPGKPSGTHGGPTKHPASATELLRRANADEDPDKPSGRRPAPAKGPAPAAELARRANPGGDPVDDAEPKPSEPSGTRAGSAKYPLSGAPDDSLGAPNGDQPHQGFEQPFRLDRESSLTTEPAWDRTSATPASSAEAPPIPQPTGPISLPNSTSAPTDPFDDEPDPFAFAASSQPAPPPDPTPKTTPPPATDGSDDWESGFAISSADD